MKISEKQSLIIIGAGAAGLMAAQLLSESFSVTILEGRNRTGGRIYSISGGEILEGGAEFIHGHLPVTDKLVKDAGKHTIASQENIYRKKNGRFEKEEEMVEGWDVLIEKMKELKADSTLNHFLNEYFPGEEKSDFRNFVKDFAMGFDLADPEVASVKHLYKEWVKDEGNNFRVKESYCSLIDFLEKKAGRNCRILTGKIVRNVNHKKSLVTVITAEGEEFTADKLIITVPVAVFQNSGEASVRFSPAVPEYMNALRSIGTGNVIKIILQFKSIFWQDDASFILSQEEIPTWWPNIPGKPFLTGWCGGPAADELTLLSEHDLKQKIIKSLSALYEKPESEIRDQLLSAQIFKWGLDPFSCGGYSYATLKTTEARKVLNTPINDTIYFAGEGYFEGEHPGTVEAAFTSGKQAAEKILSSL